MTIILYVLSSMAIVCALYVWSRVRWDPDPAVRTGATLTALAVITGAVWAIVARSWTVLGIAAASGCGLYLLSALISRRALARTSRRPDRLDDEPSLLLQASAGNDAEIRQRKLETVWRSQTPWGLQEAVSKGDAGAVAMVLDAGHDANECDVHGPPPLHLAAFAGNVNIVRLLLERGAKVDQPYAYPGGLWVTPLAVAVSRQDLAVVEALLEHGADASFSGKDGCTLLHAAASLGNTRMAALLLAHGAPPNATAANGMTALDYAARERQRGMVRFLREHGVSGSSHA